MTLKDLHNTDTKLKHKVKCPKYREATVILHQILRDRTFICEAAAVLYHVSSRCSCVITLRRLLRAYTCEQKTLVSSILHTLY